MEHTDSLSFTYYLQSQIATSKGLAVFAVTNCDWFKYSLGNG